MENTQKESTTGELIVGAITLIIAILFIGSVGYGVGVARYHDRITDREFEEYKKDLVQKNSMIFELESKISSGIAINLSEPIDLEELTYLVKKARIECEEVQGGKLKMGIVKEGVVEIEPDPFGGDTSVFVIREIPYEISCTKTIPALEETINFEIK